MFLKNLILLNLALKLADKFILLKEGSIFAVGGKEIITPENIENVYSVSVKIHKWDENLLKRSLSSYIVELIWNESQNSNQPIYFIIDDTISEKTKPSSKAKNPIEKCSFHNSHLIGLLYH